jgi:hypothetical protein
MIRPTEAWMIRKTPGLYSAGRTGMSVTIDLPVDPLFKDIPRKR